ncbi:HEAT repeat domain-containing protein [Planococcus halocryophilus]|uniref:HEAT repeat domain-containing protein n=1 Tax=Planococcus halocryophilus TaxID=1215089 RepID=UPI001F0CFE32|nr:HEAT repeat domain-containing protein [Planococcus halocryophilus]MCH4825242.1 HEAT repeat domain-containing protein [Planococcus halocryophilus]
MNIYFFWVLIAFLFLSQLLLLLFLSLRKLLINKKEQSITQEYDLLTESFSSYMMDPTDDRFLKEISISSNQTIVLEYLLNHYVAVTKGSANSPQVAQLSEKYLTERYKKQLKRRSWAIRMNTLYFIEDFHMKSLTPLLKEKLQKSFRLDQETQQLIRTLTSLNEPMTLSVLARYADAPVRLYIDVFKRLQLDIQLEELDMALKNEHNNKALKHAAVSYIGMTGLIGFLPRIEEELLSDDEELRIQALKSIQHLQSISSPSLLTPFFHSASWQERMFAARIAGKLQLSRYQEVLSELLGDSVWWVRYSSAEALTQFADGDILLSHLSANHPDRFARDMATQWEASLLGSEE